MPDIRLLTASPPVSETLPPIKPVRKAKDWNIRASPCVSSSKNTIRTTLAEIMAIQPATSKPVINLGLGDPTTLHTPPPASVTAVVETLQAGRDNGYIPGPGTIAAREAIGRYHKRWDGVNYGVNDITLTHGVGHALDTIFNILVTPHPVDSFDRRPRCNVLIPRPGFAQYGMLLNSLGAEIRFYSLKEEQNWEVDVEELNTLCDENTKAILITNPSNPCGSNFSKNHLLDILDVADRHKIPIISDEIYGHITWNAPFVPLAALSDSVPIITLSGLSKRFLLPGWRIGWIALHDPLGVAGEIQQGMVTWSNRFMGPSSIVQASLGAILETPDEWHNTCLERVKLNADIVSTAIAQIPGLSCQKPQGALYVLVKLDGALLGSNNDVEFCKALYREQGLFLMPGWCFDAPGYVRLVIASPADVTREVAIRLRDFCMRSIARA